MPPPEPPNAPPVIDMHGVAVPAMRDPSARVAEGVHWRVERGDYWVVAALQGAGKTDFLWMTAGLMAPAEGTYHLLGELMPIFEEARLHHRLRLGLVFDGGQPLNQLSVRENISLPLRYHRDLSTAEAEPFVRRLLELTELGPWADRLPGVLGRNWQKRVGLARALALRPEVLLVDNPLGGLDLRHANWWLNCFDRLAAGMTELELAAMTIIATTSDLRPWRNRAHQFAILKTGRLLVLGNWTQVQAASDELLRELLMTEEVGDAPG